MVKFGKRKKTALVFTLVFLLGAASLFAACGKQGSSNKRLVLNEVAHSIFYAPMYIALEKGYFEDEGLDVTLVTGFGADKTMTALLTGEADIGFMGCESTIYTYKEGAKDYAVSFAQLTQRAGNFLVSREKEENFKWSDLKGKEILGGRAGGMPQMVFEYILRKNGLDPKKDMSIDQSIDFGSTAAAFSGGKGQYTVEFEPHATLLEEKGDGYVVASLGEDSGYVPYTSFSVRKSYLEENGDVILAFTKALQKGMDEARKLSAEQIADIISPQFESTDKKVLTRIVDRYKQQDTWKENLIFEKESFELLENILMDSGVLDEMVPYEDLVNTEFAEKVIK